MWREEEQSVTTPANSTLIIHLLSISSTALPPECLFSRNQSSQAYIILLGFPGGVCARVCVCVCVCVCSTSEEDEPDCFHSDHPDLSWTVTVQNRL